MNLHTYLPQDRLRALAERENLPNRTQGSVLLADISGFTPLTETLRAALGPRRGAEVLTNRLDAVFAALIAAVERFGGSVIGFAGDAITCWFDDAYGPAAPRAAACALALQQAMIAFASVSLPGAASARLALKVTIATGPARRLVIGDPQIQYLDTLAGATVTRASTAEQLAQQGEVLLDEPTLQALGETATVQEWRTEDNLQRFAVLGQYPAAPQPPVLPAAAPVPDAAGVQGWVLPLIAEREHMGNSLFLTEFRPCVALFVRFTGIDYDAAGAHSRLDAFVRQVQALSRQYESTLMNLVIGDKGSYIYLNLGASGVHEDDARRAVKTALELQEAANRLGFLEPLQIGITQGLMLVGTFGGPTRRTYGAMGDEVNLSARLMQTAAPGEVLVSSHIHKAIANDFVFEPRPPLPMKGKAEPLPVFLVTGERRQRAIRLQEPVYALPMVGRQAELQMVNDKLELALQGHSQVIAIVGDAGMGKSRLVAEVIRQARRKGFAGYGGACQSDAIHTPYQVWKSIWSAFFDVDPSAPLRKQIRWLESEIEDRAPERLPALPLLGILLNLGIPDNEFTQSLEPRYRQTVLNALLEDCLRAAAQEEPLLIVLEDLHWVDALSHDLFEELVQALPDSRVCFVLAYRPQQLSLRIGQRLEAFPNFTRIELEELSKAEAEQAIRAKMGQLYPAHSSAVPAALVEKLMLRAEGNPFFLEEMLNYLRDRGLDPRDPDDLNKIELPDSLHSLILSRIDQLSEHEKSTLRVACIIGRLFRVAWLSGYYPELGSRSRVVKTLEQLARLDITPLDTPEPELSYLFKHMVTHEVTYESLPYATRARLHEQLAQYLEEQMATGALTMALWLDTMVYHYLHTENHAKQRRYLLQAGQAALEVSAYSTAWEYLARLVELTPADDRDRSALALKLAEAPYSLNNFPAALAAIQQAQAAATTDIDRAAALALLGEMTSLMGDYANARAVLSEAVPLARASRDLRALCRALYALGDVYWRLGMPAEARLALTESMDLAQALGDVTRELFALNRLGTLALRDDNAEAERIFKEVHNRALAAGNRERTMAALINLGNTVSERRDFHAARDYTYQAYALARVLGVQDVIALGALNLAEIDIHLGQFAAARREIHEGLTLALRIGLPPRVLQAVRMSAYLSHHQGQTDRALALLGLALRQPAWTDDNQYDIETVISQWALDPPFVEAGLAKGAALDWDRTIQELLQA